MDSGPGDAAFSALFRLMASQAHGAALAVYAVADGRARLVASSAGARPGHPSPSDPWPQVDPTLLSRLGPRPDARVDPAVLRLEARFCALQPLPGASGAPIGFLLAADARPRRLAGGLAGMLADAALIAAPLLAAIPPVAPRAAGAAPSHADALRLVARRSEISSFPARIATPAALLRAEAALRQTRFDGHDRHAPHAPRRAAARQHDGRLESDLAEASERGELRLAFQAYVDLADGRASGAEALLRWRHPTRGELPPAAFIPLAEATGLILPLGAWALRTALAAAARWPRRLALSVNVSALQFHQPGFVAQIEAALVASGVAPERLELEITETVLMRDNPETKAQLDALIARGVRIALDDFGTGYSALAYLARLPHHRIKLDRAFVQDLANPATLELVRAILALARRTGVAVTAEGVERPDQLRLVRALGFTHAQGFVTGAPVDDPDALLADPQPAL